MSGSRCAKAPGSSSGAGLTRSRSRSRRSRRARQFHLAPGQEHCLIGTEDLLVFERSTDPKGMDQDLIFIYEPDGPLTSTLSAKSSGIVSPPANTPAARPSMSPRTSRRSASRSALISCVGRDPLGDEILAVAKDKASMSSSSRARGSASPTGTVIVDARSNSATPPTSWCNRRRGTKSACPTKRSAAVAEARAFIYGSLAGRSPYNLEQLGRLLDVQGPLKFFDVNLRPPFADPHAGPQLAKRADVLKLNDGEVGRLAHWIQTGEEAPDTPRDEAAIARHCETLAAATGVRAHLRHARRRRRGLVGRRQPHDRARAARGSARHRRRGRRLHGRTDGRPNERNRNRARSWKTPAASAPMSRRTTARRRCSPRSSRSRFGRR